MKFVSQKQRPGDTERTCFQEVPTGSCSVSIMILFLPLKTLVVSWDMFDVLLFKIISRKLI